MPTRNQPIYQQLVDAVIERDASCGVQSLPSARDLAIKSCLASTDFSLYFASSAAAKFGGDYRASCDGLNVTGLPGLPVSRHGLELTALVLADVRAREGNGSPDGGHPTFNIDDYLTDQPHLVPDRSNWRNPDPGGGAGAARPVEYEYRKAA
jgi:hypothetical protein